MHQFGFKLYDPAFGPGALGGKEEAMQAYTKYQLCQNKMVMLLMPLLSFRRTPESRFYQHFWTPVFTGCDDS